MGGRQLHLQADQTKLNSTRVTLGIARKSLDVARRALAKRVISVYMEQGDASDSTVAILFQATSLQDMIDRIEAAQRISDHDAQVVKQVKVFSRQVAAQATVLERLQPSRRSYLAQVTAEKNALEQKIAERKAYVKSVKHEIASLLAEQQRQAADRRRAGAATVAGYTHAPVAVNDQYTTVPGLAGRQQVVQYAMSRLGDPYVWGAAAPIQFDCSGLVVWAFAQVGINLPHYTDDLMAGGTPISDEPARARRPRLLLRRRPRRHLHRRRAVHPRAAHRHGRPGHEPGLVFGRLLHRPALRVVTPVGIPESAVPTRR